MVLVACTATFLAVAIYVLGQRRIAYSHVRHTISELGEHGSRDERWASWGVFLPVGIAMAVTWFLYRQSTPQAAALGGVIAVGYIGGAIFPCDAGSPTQGSWRQTLHNLAGGIEYVGGIACLLFMSRQQTLFVVPAAIVAIATFVISMPPAPMRGLAQRIAEISLFGSLLTALAYF